jgi:hypothetical protein
LISFACLTCSTSYSVPDDKAGKRTRCPACGQALIVPTPAPAPPPEDALVDIPMPKDKAVDAPLPERPLAAPSLQPCPDCRREVSKRAAQCPHCGCPLKAGAAQPSPYEAVFAAFVRAVRESGYTIDSLDKQNGRIVFTTGASWFSWGNELTLVLIDNGDDTCSGDVTNRHGQLHDWGTGSRIIQKVTARALEMLADQGMADCFR